MRIFLFSALFYLLTAQTLAGSDSKIRVLVIDGFSNHDWSYTTEVITTLLEGSGFCEVHISTAPEVNSAAYNDWNPDFSNYDVVVQNSNSLRNGNKWPESVEKKFEQYMMSGGGMFVFHSANNSFEHWEEYNKMIGLGWRKADQGEAIEIVNGKMVRIPAGEGPGTNHGPRRTFLVELMEKHPINRDFPGKWMTPDFELFAYARGTAENLRILSYAYDSITGKNWPVDWVVEYGKGRIYNGTFGHLWHDLRMPESIQCVGFQTTFFRAVQWLAGREVTYEVPDNFPTESEVVLRPFELIYRGQDGWNSLYNGSNLNGWHTMSLPADRNKTFWLAKEGYIECNALGRTDHNYYWLVSDEEYNDFQLRLEFQVFKKSTGNSGLQFRSRYDESDEKSEGGWMNGPQADIHSPTPLRTGLIYDETRGIQHWIYPSLPDYKMVADKAPEQAHKTELVYADDDPDAWNSLELICQGLQIRIFVNGRRVTRFDAAGILDDEIHKKLMVGITGHLALQLHSSQELLIRFRNIYIRTIDHGLSNK